MGFVTGMTAGFTVLTAQKFGAGDMQGMRRTVAGGRNPLILDRIVSYGYFYVIYETAVTSDAHAV